MQNANFVSFGLAHLVDTFVIYWKRAMLAQAVPPYSSGSLLGPISLFTAAEEMFIYCGPFTRNGGEKKTFVRRGRSSRR